jgi:HD-GYP domain-containing protein (c-di-GMP phosphodiesterase class II)
LSTYNVNLHEAVYSLSDALDLVGVTHIHHGKRVAYMAAECGKHLGWSGPRLDELFQAAILHDSGVSRTMVHANLAQMAWENEKEHCKLGAELLASSPLLKHLSDTVLHHHTHWSELKDMDLPLEVKLRANCIYMVDRVDVLALGYQLEGKDILLGKNEIRQKIFQRRGDWFCPELVDAFMEISNSDALWFTLVSDHVNGYLATWLSHYPEQTMEFEELRGLVRVFSCIVDAKSPFTKQHSDGVANLARYLGMLFQLPEETCEMLELVGLLHDIGKLRVPDKLLDKPGLLDEEELIIMRRHSFDTYSILKNIRGLERISLWALQHHERMDGTGYPNHLKGIDLSFEARIVAVADVFQALAQSRPYRGPLEQQVIITLLKLEAAGG